MQYQHTDSVDSPKHLKCCILVAGPSQPAEAVPEPSSDVLKKQQELFASLDQQYQVARAATHTQRGLGLGFSSNSSYPR